MITQLSPLLHNVATEVKAEDLLLKKGAWVFFSPTWPDSWKWAKGKLFEIPEETIVVSYAVSKILPIDDYKDIDLSNSTDGLKLYPEDESVLYECAVGFKPGDYITHIYVPKDKYVYSLRQSTMYPDVTDADKLYLGGKFPSDSPHTSPLLFLYFIKDGPAFYLRPRILESVTYDKATIVFQVNKCKLREIPRPTDPSALIKWDDKVAKAKRIAYYEDLMGY